MAQEKKRSSLLEALTTPRTEHSVGQCKLSVIVGKMDAEHKEAIDRAIELIREDDGQGRSKAYSVSWLTGALRKNGYSISMSTIQRHINGDCPCERTTE
jgi:hypothetical protein